MSGIYGCETVKDIISDYGLLKLIGMIPYIIVLLVLLRKKMGKWKGIWKESAFIHSLGLFHFAAIKCNK